MVRRTACLKATARGVPISTQAACCSYYYYRGHAGELDRPPRSSASKASPIASVRPGFNNPSNLSSGAARDAPRGGHGATSTAAAAAALVVGQTRNKSTAALMEETDSDVGRGATVDRGTGDGGSLTSFRLTGEQPGYKQTSVFKRFSIEAASTDSFLSTRGCLHIRSVCTNLSQILIGVHLRLACMCT